MDISKDLLGKCSPYIFALIYDIDERALVIECVTDPRKPEPALRLIFPGITHYSEDNLLDAPDDENMDDIVEILPTREEGYLITTYKKEITIKTTEEPVVETI